MVRLMKDLKQEIEINNNEDLENNKSKDLIYVIKSNVPFADFDVLRDWNEVCQKKSPEGFDDYRWGKIKYDHLFTKNFKPILEKVIDELNTINEQLILVNKKLAELEANKETDDDHKGLMKGKKKE